MKVRLNREQPTAAQRKALRNECVKEFHKLLDIYNHEAAMQVLHILHFEFGFGQQRLKKFAEKLAEMQTRQKEKYDLADSDTGWLCEKQLREDGINVDELLKDGETE